MAYLTTHSIAIMSPHNGKDVYDRFINETEYQEYNAVDWYRCNSDCERISKERPDCLIIVTGQGEYIGDVWKKAYLAGVNIWHWKLELPQMPKDVLIKVNKNG